MLVAAGSLVAAAPAEAQEVDFQRDIRPILSNKCFKCHGPALQESGLRLDDRERATRRKVVVPGEPDKSKLIESPVRDPQHSFDDASDDLRFAAAVAGFGMMLRNSPHKGDLTYDAVLSTATRSMGKDASGYRAEFIDLVRKAKTLSGQ